MSGTSTVGNKSLCTGQRDCTLEQRPYSTCLCSQKMNKGVVLLQKIIQCLTGCASWERSGNGSMYGVPARKQTKDLFQSMLGHHMASYLAHRSMRPPEGFYAINVQRD